MDRSIVISGPYGKFQLVDPNDRNSTGYMVLKHPFFDSEDQEQMLEVEVHFRFLKVNYPDAMNYQAVFERDLRQLVILLDHDWLKRGILSKAPEVVYTSLIFE